nr:uncharacterized protein LOC113740892 [Coffea arabica]
MDERRSGRGSRQAQPQGDEQGSATGPTRGQENIEVNQMATAINRMTDILERLAERQGPGPLNQPGAQDRGEDRALERFLKFNLPKFIGGPDPELAENWLERMTNIFAVLNYAEERRVTFAVFQFEGAARAWWDMIRGKWERAQTPWTWENLLREFNEKFFPPLIQEKRENEFIKVKRGASSVAEYEGKFTKFSKYALELVATERRRIRRFVQGLNVEIQEGLAAAQISTFPEALEKAQRVESARVQVKHFHAKKRGTPSHPLGQVDKGAAPSKKEKGTGGVETSSTSKRTQSRGGHNRRGQQRETPLSGQAVAPQVICGYCRKPNHTENECWKKSGKCLYCCSIKHQIANCPSIPKKGGSAQRPDKSVSKQSNGGGSRSKAPARIYALDYHQVSDPAKVIEGL